MAIDLRKYIDITSGVGGGIGVRQRDLIMRIFTTSNEIPTKSVVEMSTTEQVADYFGATSDEAKRAAFYFGFISKRITKALKISFARAPVSDTAPTIYGESREYKVSDFSGITTGRMTLRIGNNIGNVFNLNLSNSNSLTSIASALQTAVRAANSNAVFNSTIVQYDVTRKRFELTGGGSGENAISISVSTSSTLNAVQNAFGFSGLNARFSDGVDAQEPVAIFQDSIEKSNNFGSFIFANTLTLDETEAVAIYNQTRNVEFMFLFGVTSVAASSYSSRLEDIAGITLTLNGNAETANDSYHQMVPGIILAATDYSKRNSVANYMFQILDLTPTVTTSALSDAYDKIRVNYYGNTQKGGQTLNFYQRGYMMGSGTDVVDQNVYANEIWLKDYAASQIMGLLLSHNRIPANPTGLALIESGLQVVIQAALLNGTISIGRPINNTQKQFIVQVTGEENAFVQVQNNGYFIGLKIESVVGQNGTTEYKITYSLIYTKDDVVRKVEGSHILI